MLTSYLSPTTKALFEDALSRCPEYLDRGGLRVLALLDDAQQRGFSEQAAHRLMAFIFASPGLELVGVVGAAALAPFLGVLTPKQERELQELAVFSGYAEILSTAAVILLQELSQNATPLSERSRYVQSCPRRRRTVAALYNPPTTRSPPTSSS